jgi:hypothetical protein
LLLNQQFRHFPFGDLHPHIHQKLPDLWLMFFTS